MVEIIICLAPEVEKVLAFAPGTDEVHRVISQRLDTPAQPRILCYCIKHFEVVRMS